MRGWKKRRGSALAGLMLVLCEGSGVAQSPASPPAVQPLAAPPPAAPPPEVTAPEAPASAPETPASEPPPPPPTPEPPPAVRHYGDRGTSEIALGLGYSSIAGFLAAGGFRYFVIDRVAPGFEGTYVRGGTAVASYGLALGSIRVVPVSTPSVALVLTGRAGRMFLADHVDGWVAGAGAGIIFPVGGGAGIELGYQFLRLFPASFCADLSTCVLHGLVFGLRLIL